MCACTKCNLIQGKLCRYSTKMAAGGHQKINISYLKKHYHLCQDSLEGECPDEHVLKISGQLGSWDRLGPHLGLTTQHIEAIRRNSDTEEGRREATLRKWKQVFAFNATYIKLLEALLAIERADLASNICKLITQQQGNKLCNCSCTSDY